MIGAILLVIITFFIPPLGVFLIGGCGCDLLINVLLTLLGYFPGHIHAYYLEYVYYHRRDLLRAGAVVPDTAAGVYSPRILRGGEHNLATGSYAPVNPGAQGQTTYGTATA